MLPPARQENQLTRSFEAASGYAGPDPSAPAAGIQPALCNRLLTGLPPDILAQLRQDMRRVTLVSGQVLHGRGDPIDQVYFIESGLASLTAETFDNGAVEVGLTGHEGFVGVAALLSAHPVSRQRAFMQIPGEALRLSRQAFVAACDASRALRAQCLAYVGVLMEQTAQTAACNARHDVTERLARWLLMSHDRIDGDQLPLTQEFLAFMLGVRRPGVAVSASALQSAGLIQYARGRIKVLDRPGLEAAACRCYQLIRLTELPQGQADESNGQAAGANHSANGG